MRAAARFYAWWKPRFCVASIADRMTSRVGWRRSGPPYGTDALKALDAATTDDANLLAVIKEVKNGWAV